MRGELTVTYGAEELFPSALYKEASKTGSSMGEGAINGHRQDLEPQEGATIGTIYGRDRHLYLI